MKQLFFYLDQPSTSSSAAVATTSAANTKQMLNSVREICPELASVMI